MTPVMSFSLAIVAPNGPEMCAALGLWCSLLGLASPSVAHAHGKVLIAVATLDAMILTTLRSIGPLWVLLIVGTAVLRDQHLAKFARYSSGKDPRP